MWQRASSVGWRVALLCLVVLVGCSEDLAPLTASWAQMRSRMVARAGALRTQHEGVLKTVRGLPPVGATDTTAQTLTGQLNVTVAGYANLLNDLDSTISTASAAVQEAIKTGKVATLQKAMDDGKVAYEAAMAKTATSAGVIAGLLKQLRAHNAELAAERARINTAGSKMDFTDIDFKPGKAEFLFDRPTTQAALDKLLGFVNSCPELAVDLIGHTSNEGTASVNRSLSVSRAKAVKQWLMAKGVAAKKLHSVSGVGATENAVAEPDATTASAKNLPPLALEELRRKNRRVTVVVVTPCTAH